MVPLLSLRSEEGGSDEGTRGARSRFLQIGEKHGYNRRGMAGFYQQLVEPGPGYKTRLTDTGRKRLLFLRDRYGQSR